MKFIVSRTNGFTDKPCDEAIKEECIRVDTRTTDDPAKIPFYKGNKEKAEKEWYGHGTNHRVVNGNIKRDFKDENWFVEINSLNELNEFIDKYGQIVYGKSYWNDEIYEIEIYDGYRE